LPIWVTPRRSGPEYKPENGDTDGSLGWKSKLEEQAGMKRSAAILMHR
jgi:hypothetical protein